MTFKTLSHKADTKSEYRVVVPNKRDKLISPDVHIYFGCPYLLVNL